MSETVSEPFLHTKIDYNFDRVDLNFIKQMQKAVD